MLRLGLMLGFIAAAAAVPDRGSATQFCYGETECPQDCRFVGRNARCIFCDCSVPPYFPTPPLYPGEGDQCKYGPGYIDECTNDCKCIRGGRYGCTRKLCMPGQTSDKPMTCSGAQDLPKRAGLRVFCHKGLVKVQPLDARCLPGAVFMDVDGCNTCVCSEYGEAGCTLMLCPEIEERPGCPYGPGFIDECNNDCKCVDGRFYGCTRKSCKPEEHSQVPKKCTIYDPLPSRTDQEVFCDEGIIKLQRKEPGCPYGPGFIDECDNDCTCVDGRSYDCTRKDCEYDQNAEVPKTCSILEILPSRPGLHVYCSGGIIKLEEPVCPYGKEFIDECGNDCRCLEHGYACSLKACKPGQISMKPMTCDGIDDLPSRKGRRVICHQKVVKVQNEDEPCPGGAFFAADCNHCSCSSDGKTACSLTACPRPESGNAVTCERGLPRCPEDCGQVFNLARGCYDCICSVGNPGDLTVQHGQDCPPGTVETGSGAFFKTCGPSPQCPYGLNFIDQCNNDCVCSERGYICTLKICQYGQIPMRPQECHGSANLPERTDERVYCDDGIVKVQDKDDQCIPGSVFKEDCNSCFCGTNGIAGCTFKLCPPKGGCEYGPSYIDQCDNDCECVNGESYACTRKACGPRQVSKKPKTCKGPLDLPDRIGRLVVCFNGIVIIVDNERDCPRGAFYKNDCNSCICGGGCTLAACPRPGPYK